jgi:tetratricopeptide (TPR) repeat protein
MPLTGRSATKTQRQKARLAAGLLSLALVALASGCASTDPKHQVTLTGDIMVDGPNAIANGPPRDRLLWEYRTAAAAMRQGKFDLARQDLDDALTRLQAIYGPDPNARKARGYFHAEAKKNFIGEPYERSMAYIYRGILYWMQGEPDNARACFRSAEFEDSDAENHAYAGDWVLPDYLEGLASMKLGGDGSDAFKRAEASAHNIKLPPYNPQANVLFFVEFGAGPTKYASGQYGEELRFRVPPANIKSAEIKVDAFKFPVAPTDDVWFLASTRGGREMDHILGN